MKEIKIIKDDEKCLAAIDAALQAANGRAEKFAITDSGEVVRRATEAYEKLACIPRRDRAGAQASYYPAGPGRGYGYNAASTTLRFRVGGDGKTLYLKYARSIKLRPGERACLDVWLCPSAHTNYVAARSCDFGILKDDAIEAATLAREAAALKEYVEDVACLDGMAA